MEMTKESLKMDRNQKLALLVVALAIFTDMLIYCMIVPILPQYAAEHGASQEMIGIMFACYAVAFLVTTPLVGVPSDRFGRKTPMLAGLAGLFASTLLFAFSSDMTVLMIARALQGVSAAATWTAGLALVADMFPAESRQMATGIALTGSIAGTLLGPLFGGFLYDFGGYLLPFLAAAGLVLVDGAARLLLLKDPPRNVTGEKTSIIALARDRTILIMAGIIVVVAGTTGMLEPTLPLYLVQIGISPAMIGLLFAVVALASLVASPLSATVVKRFGRKKTITVGLAITAILLPLAAVAGSFLAEALVMALLGAVLAIGLASVPQEMTDIAERKGGNGNGAVYALFNVAMSVGMMVGPMAGGLLAGSLGIFPGLAIAGAGMLAYAAVIAFNFRPAGGKTASDAPLVA
jgi:MFS transporter, DHA1 family, solute carrier family 18 (vesicular amine transporter), member 1/2